MTQLSKSLRISSKLIPPALVLSPISNLPPVLSEIGSLKAQLPSQSSRIVICVIRLIRRTSSLRAFLLARRLEDNGKLRSRFLARLKGQRFNP